MYRDSMHPELLERMQKRFHLDEVLKPEGRVPPGWQILDLETDLIVGVGFEEPHVAEAFAAGYLTTLDRVHAFEGVRDIDTTGCSDLSWFEDDEGEPVVLLRLYDIHDEHGICNCHKFMIDRSQTEAFWLALEERQSLTLEGTEETSRLSVAPADLGGDPGVEITVRVEQRAKTVSISSASINRIGPVIEAGHSLFPD